MYLQNEHPHDCSIFNLPGLSYDVGTIQSSNILFSLRTSPLQAMLMPTPDSELWLCMHWMEIQYIYILQEPKFHRTNFGRVTPSDLNRSRQGFLSGRGGASPTDHGKVRQGFLPGRVTPPNELNKSRNGYLGGGVGLITPPELTRSGRQTAGYLASGRATPSEVKRQQQPGPQTTSTPATGTDNWSKFNRLIWSSKKSS